MKKLFTFAAAILASAAMMANYAPTADEVIILNNVYSATATEAGYSTHAAIAWEGTVSWNSKKAGDPDNEGESTSSNVQTCSVKGNGAGKNLTISVEGCTKIVLYHEKQSSRYVEFRDGGKTGTLLATSAGNTLFTEVALDAATAYSIFLHGIKDGGGDQDLYVYAVKLVAGSVVPVTDPVASVVIDGPEAVYVGKAATYAATTDVKADEYKWFVNNVEQADATAKSFAYTPEAEGTFNIVCKAKNANNTDWVVSNTIALVASVRPTISDLVVVDNDIVWDFNNAAAATIAAEEQNDTVIFFNAGEWAEGFAADKIAGRGQYYYYSDNKCFQGHVLKFVTSVAGSIVVEFSNTGKPERPYRHLFVNGADTEYKSNSTAKVTTDAIAVPAGEVVLCGMMENGEDPMTLNMLRIYKITFTKDQETAIENTEEAVKAVKFFQNGQLFIEKNGVIYNAQGAIVK